MHSTNKPQGCSNIKSSTLSRFLANHTLCPFLLAAWEHHKGLWLWTEMNTGLFGLSKLSSGKILHWVIVMYFLHPVCLHILLSYLFGLKRFKNLQGGHVLQIKLSTSDMEKTIPDHSIWHYIYASSHLSLLSFFDPPVKYQYNAHEYQNNSPQTDSNIQNKWLYAKKNIHSAITFLQITCNI